MEGSTICNNPRCVKCGKVCGITRQYDMPKDLTLRSMLLKTLAPARYARIPLKVGRWYHSYIWARGLEAGSEVMDHCTVYLDCQTWTGASSWWWPSVIPSLLGDWLGYHITSNCSTHCSYPFTACLMATGTCLAGRVVIDTSLSTHVALPGLWVYLCLGWRLLDIGPHSPAWSAEVVLHWQCS